MVFNYNILSGYSEHYNESSFSDKLNRFCSSIGKEVVRKVLTLYYVENPGADDPCGQG